MTTTKQIDRFISAEILDKNEDPELNQIVTDHMMHGPCGPQRPTCPCTIKNKCTKRFPKEFNDSTVIDESDYALYKRRNDGCKVTKSGTELHNGYIAPYNPGLLRRYQSHINVEWCNQMRSIKYLFKYINKGPDRVTAAVEDEEIEEIKDFYDCRYLSACEAAWRIYKFDIHYRFPPVERLPFHLESEQSVIFDSLESIDCTPDKASVNDTRFVAWMETNKTDVQARSPFYHQFPERYVWKQEERKWVQGQKGICLGRVHHVSPSTREVFYLRVLINKVPGAQDWKDFKKFKDVTYNTYKEACQARGLLEDDKEYVDGLLEASLWGTGNYLRKFYVILILKDCLSRPEFVYEKTWEVMATDVLHAE